ncbi:MAG: DEAD/DEAH box helicase [Bacteroidota bacterium]
MNKVISRRSKFSRPSSQHNKNTRKVSSFNPDQLIKEFSNQEETIHMPTWKYEDLPLNPGLKANLILKGYHDPTPIQEQSIKPLIEGKDLIGIASTGTGKTAAFLIPVIQQMLERDNIQALVVLPTRELALQVEQEFIGLSKGLGLKASCFIGGQNISVDKQKLRTQNDLIIGTPGRLIDLKNQGFLKLGEVNTLILDEFDRMLDMGFIEDIKKIIAAIKNRKQTMFFSATKDKKQQYLIDQILTNPVEIKVSNGADPSEKVTQEIIRVPIGGNKFNLLIELISGQDFEKVIIFAETKHLVNRLGKKLNQYGIKSGLIHGNKSQNSRKNAITEFNRGRIQVLVATDIAARGLDLPDVTHVINYELPRTRDSYIHRIGRTGRAGKKGIAYTLTDSPN